MSEPKIERIARERNELLYYVRQMADGACAYGDGCPANAGTRHGTCSTCRARRVLDSLGIEAEA